MKVRGNLLKKAITKIHTASILFLKYDSFVQVSKLKRDVLTSQLSNKITKNCSASGLDDGTDLSLLNGNAAMDDGNNEDDKKEGEDEYQEEEGEEEYHKEEDEEEEEEYDSNNNNDDDDTSVDNDDDHNKITQEEGHDDDDNSNEEDDDDSDDDDSVPPNSIQTFFQGYGRFTGKVTISTTTNTDRKHYLVIYAEDNDKEVCTQPQLKLLIRKQNIEIGELGYKFVCKYGGMFYSGIVESYHSTKNDTRVCLLNYGQLREYTLEKLKE